jgi:hypothetical protein
VDLAPISSTDGIAQAIFESIGVRLAAGDDMRAQLMVYLALEAWCDGLAYLGAWTEIREVAIKAIDLAESSGATWWRAGMPNWLGIAESQLGNFEAPRLR